MHTIRNFHLFVCTFICSINLFSYSLVFSKKALVVFLRGKQVICMKKQEFVLDNINENLLLVADKLAFEDNFIDKRCCYIKKCATSISVKINNLHKLFCTCVFLYVPQHFLYVIKHFNFIRCRSPPFYKSSIQKTYKMEEI